jgi:hypothetical protein
MNAELARVLLEQMERTVAELYTGADRFRAEHPEICKPQQKQS